MSSFIASNSVYNIQTEREIWEALNSFSPEFILDTMQYRFEDRLNFYQVNTPNIPAVWEVYFKQLENNYPDNVSEIQEIRENTYRQIMEILCEKCHLRLNIENISDYYSAAYYLYDFLISEFTNHMIQFFSNFILKEKNGIYASFNLADKKRSKDSSTIYNKKMIKNSKIAVINANLEFIIENISAFNIDFPVILENIYKGRPEAVQIMNICSPIDDFYHTNYVPVITGQFKPILITSIRNQIQQDNMNQINDIEVGRDE